MTSNIMCTADIEVLTVAHTPDNKFDTGCMCGHTLQMYTSRKLTFYKICQLYPTHEDLIRGLALIHSHLARFGLEVHIGQDGKPSNTECVSSSPPSIL